MGLFRGKRMVELATPDPVPDPVEQRFNSASALHESSLALFHDIAGRLTESHSRYMSLIKDIDDELLRLSQLRNESSNRAMRAHESMQSILDLTRGFRND